METVKIPTTASSLELHLPHYQLNSSATRGIQFPVRRSSQRGDTPTSIPPYDILTSDCGCLVAASHNVRDLQPRTPADGLGDITHHPGRDIGRALRETDTPN